MKPILTTENERGQRSLAGAVFKGDRETTRLLLDAGAVVDGAGPDGRTALMFAAMFDRLEMIDLASCLESLLFTQ